MVRMIMIVDVALEVVGAMKPWASADEDTARKPFRAVVAIGSAAIGRSVVVTVGAVRSGSNVDADADLGFHSGSGHHEANSRKSGYRKAFESAHRSPYYRDHQKAVVYLTPGRLSSGQSRHQQIAMTDVRDNTFFLVLPTQSVGAVISICAPALSAKSFFGKIPDFGG
jgi:hypothetical protein